MSAFAQHAAGIRRMRTTDVSVVIINADEKLTTRASVAIIMAAIESVSGVQIAGNGMLTLEVKPGTLLLDLRKALRDALALLDVDFLIHAPEDEHEERNETTLLTQPAVDPEQQEPKPGQDSFAGNSPRRG